MEKQIPKPRYIVQPHPAVRGRFMVKDIFNMRASISYYFEHEAKQTAEWLNQRTLGYPV